jgi:hypothetical protein
MRLKYLLIKIVQGAVNRKDPHLRGCSDFIACRYLLSFNPKGKTRNNNHVVKTVLKKVYSLDFEAVI